MVKMKIAIRLAMMSAMMAAICAFTTLVAIRPRRMRTGIAASMVDRTALPVGS
ncbi:hypothetical protein D3C87_2022780 [compost metagenome]